MSKGLRWPSLAVVGCWGPSWACVGLPWAAVGLCWPSLGAVGRRWPSLGAVGLRGPALAFRGLLWACVGLRWPSLAAVGFRGPALAFRGLLWAFVGRRWCCGPLLAVVGCGGPALAFVGRRWLLWAFVGFCGPVVGRTRVRLLVRTFMEPRKQKKIKKDSRTHVQKIVRVFGGLDRGNGGGKTHLKQKKGSRATLFLFYRPCCGKWAVLDFGLRTRREGVVVWGLVGARENHQRVTTTCWWGGGGD